MKAEKDAYVCADSDCPVTMYDYRSETFLYFHEGANADRPSFYIFKKKEG